MENKRERMRMREIIIGKLGRKEGEVAVYQMIRFTDKMSATEA